MVEPTCRTSGVVQLMPVNIAERHYIHAGYLQGRRKIGPSHSVEANGPDIDLIGRGHPLAQDGKCAVVKGG